MIKENFDFDMHKFMNPIVEYIEIVSDITSDKKSVKQAINKLRQYSGEDIPHDFGLYQDEITRLKELLELNFSIEKFPELWI